MNNRNLSTAQLAAQSIGLLATAVLICSMLMGSSCGNDAVIRDRTVYETELNFMEKASMDQAELLAGWIKTSCACSDGEFTTAQCGDTAAAVVAVRARIPWHKAMSRYNAGLDEERPPQDPPEIPDAATLCPEASP